jgi:hypothetical protein
MGRRLVSAEGSDEGCAEERERAALTVVDEHDVERLGVIRFETLDDEEDAPPVCNDTERRSARALL